ncbi:DUF1285 domain-containing protein [Aidingimonas lacisalsi]|uniref:DUF1285 domain-containing protein n=1 Tax=Aidingimonas lacisalsi TaxID=2604086 RepID=UPI0011D1A8A0|nr:DUF1285 domain-containing protein [Aidingimonas lacisalsi]
MSLDAFLAPLEQPGVVPPLDHWRPPFLGDMDLCITADGQWVHEGRAIERPRLAQLLATLLWRDDDGDYYLVSPVEKWRIRVEDCPFVVVDASAHDDDWIMTTNMADRVRLDASHPLMLSQAPAGECIPEVPVRFGLTARINRNVYYHLIEHAERRASDDWIELGITSAGHWHSLGGLDRASL